MAEPTTSSIESPPQTIPGIVRRLGPGLIIAGSIVGSGELIATTKTGAQAGFWLLWLIIIGCLIKVFAQVEFGRYTISSGKATMAALDELPVSRSKKQIKNEQNDKQKNDFPQIYPLELTEDPAQ